MMPRYLDEHLPHQLYMSLNTLRSCDVVNTLFTARGWSSRMCSWTEHEVTSNYAELVIASESPILISGGIDREPSTVDKILSILDDAGIAYEFEVYDEQDRLLRSKP